MKPYVIGVDIGGTAVKLGLFSVAGTLLEQWSIGTRRSGDGASILPDVAETILATLAAKEIAPEMVEGIGIGVPGPVDAENNVFFCVNLGWREPFNLKDRMNELLPQIPNVKAANDANVATLGEMWKGGAQGCTSAVMLTLGTGVGGGVVLGGKLLAGVHGGAGEIGHMTVSHHETIQCTCGRYGCLEQYASARGIVHLAKTMLAEETTASALRELDDFTAKEICDLAREGDEMALQIVQRCGRFLGRAMSFVSCTIDPEIFLIGGGMSKAGDVLMEAIRLGYRKYAFPGARETPIRCAELGNDAGIYGCANMIL